MIVKIRYVLKTIDGRFIYQTLDLNQIETGGLHEFLFGLNDVTIISKDVFLGLYDENGCEVYDNDILYCSEGDICSHLLVSWKEFEGRWSITRSEDGCDELQEYGYNMIDTILPYRIIGNKHENANLLEL
jgi:hypothetical protein